MKQLTVGQIVNVRITPEVKERGRVTRLIDKTFLEVELGFDDEDGGGLEVVTRSQVIPLKPIETKSAWINLYEGGRLGTKLHPSKEKAEETASDGFVMAVEAKYKLPKL